MSVRDLRLFLEIRENDGYE